VKKRYTPPPAPPKLKPPTPIQAQKVGQRLGDFCILIIDLSARLETAEKRIAELEARTSPHAQAGYD